MSVERNLLMVQSNPRYLTSDSVAGALFQVDAEIAGELVKGEDAAVE